MTPHLETVSELVEDLADKLGIYAPIPDGDHPEACLCRICFSESMEKRIVRAVANDKLLSGATT